MKNPSLFPFVNAAKQHQQKTTTTRTGTEKRNCSYDKNNNNDDDKEVVSKSWLRLRNMYYPQYHKQLDKGYNETLSISKCVLINVMFHLGLF